MLWLVMYAVSTLYTFAWDVLQDWGLGYPTYGYLRKKRLFARPSVRCGRAPQGLGPSSVNQSVGLSVFCSVDGDGACVPWRCWAYKCRQNVQQCVVAPFTLLQRCLAAFCR